MPTTTGTFRIRPIGTKNWILEEVYLKDGLVEWKSACGLGIVFPNKTAAEAKMLELIANIKARQEHESQAVYYYDSAGELIVTLTEV